MTSYYYWVMSCVHFPKNLRDSHFFMTILVLGYGLSIKKIALTSWDTQSENFVKNAKIPVLSVILSLSRQKTVHAGFMCVVLLLLCMF
jgi:hypothetical protein